ncbi:phospho-sugar mutase [Mycoplasma sp. Mirounga ES2805-ORL]|nr:phospho-sugar mutase [Mycoplasma sp. Mirounga ES2805-ORL]
MNKLSFGTAGIRGIVGNGEDHLGFAYVRQIANGYAKYLSSKYANLDEIKVVIGRDNRINSYEFSVLIAQIMHNYGITPIYSEEITPTPFVSYVVKTQKAQGAFNITASHNPAQYNGIKLYNDKGYQMLPEEIEEVKSFFKPWHSYKDEYKLDKQLNKINYPRLIFFSPKWKKNYIKELSKIGPSIEINKIKIGYSPLHGTGSVFIKDIFDSLKMDYDSENPSTFFEKEQMVIDDKFSFVQYPNPEKPEAYERLLKLGKKHDLDALIVTDPDSDRVGIVCKNKKRYIQLNGNETAILIFNFLLETTKHYKNKHLIYSFVSTNLPSVIAKQNKIESHVVPTGFKWIGMLINQLKEQNKEVIYAFEESYGSLINNKIALDKDALQSVVILLKMIQYYKNRNLTLIDVLQNIYKKYGFIESGNIEIEIKENICLEDIQNKFKEINLENSILEDFNNKDDFLKSNMLKISFSNSNSWIALRPSGTEPKIKFYIFAYGKTKKEAKNNFEFFKSKINSCI